MATLPFPIKPLDGADGYLRWKESVLLGLHMVDVAHVLYDDPPAPAVHGHDGDCANEAKKWARDDALCRGHILAALSDRLLPVYVRHATGKELEFRDDETLRVRVARAEALAIAGFPCVPDSLVGGLLRIGRRFTILPRKWRLGRRRSVGAGDPKHGDGTDTMVYGSLALAWMFKGGSELTA